MHYAKTACQRKQSHNTSTNIHHTNINKQLATQVDPITRHKRLTISPCLFTRKPFDGCRVYQMSHEYLRFCHRRRSPRTGNFFEAVLFLAVAHTACTLFHSNESVLQLQGESLEAPITSLSRSLALCRRRRDQCVSGRMLAAYGVSIAAACV